MTNNEFAPIPLTDLTPAMKFSRKLREAIDNTINDMINDALEQGLRDGILIDPNDDPSLDDEERDDYLYNRADAFEKVIMTNTWTE